MTKLQQLDEKGQSVWYDNIRRALIDSGELQQLVDLGVTGITSNPSIFEKAIAGSTDYDEALGDLVTEGKSVEEIYEALVLEDIARAADVLRPVFDRTKGLDGYVSLEVDPRLAHDTQGTIADARRLFTTLARPNVMIKVPATPEGLPAITTLIGEGVNVNVTLMFSLDHYDAVAEAYIAGLEKMAASGGNLAHVASVASFFVSRVDTATDRALEEKGNRALQGKIAIANSKATYARFKDTFSGERWETLKAQGARVQRPLWASTSTKNPDYPDTLYVDTLIGPHTVNTMPPKTVQAFLDHGTIALTLEKDIEQVWDELAALTKAGVELKEITEQLQIDGVAAFSRAFESLLAAIADKRRRLLAEWQRRSAHLGDYQSLVDVALEEMVRDEIVPRIWSRDHTVWKPDPSEITNRLGWLTSPQTMVDKLSVIQDFVDDVVADGYSDVLLLGMGGSSLAPEVFGKVFGNQVSGMPRLAVLDSTDPGAVLGHATRLDPARTLFIVATKSGGTVETLSFFKYFYNWAQRGLGNERVGDHFVAITDPGSKLESLAKHYSFRATFLNDPHIGGRYSALSYFGLVPAALVGVDVETLLEQAQAMACSCKPCNCPVDGENNGAWLGAILGELSKAGRDKVTFVASPALASFGDWVEQLVAESTGKEGQGIVPVVGELLSSLDVYGQDRLFVYLQLAGDTTYDGALESLQDAGHPVVRLGLRDLYDLGEQFVLWEFATAVAGYRLGINPFDQPNVESAKFLARKAVADYDQTGALPESDAEPLSGEALLEFLDQAQKGDYVAVQAYVAPSAEVGQSLKEMRVRLRNRTLLATTVGYGPRFLHSTGQLHKGDRGNGLFIQLTSDPVQDADIPVKAGASESTMSFGVLETAQALGDKQALLAAGRRVLRFHLGRDVLGGLQLLIDALA